MGISEDSNGHNGVVHRTGKAGTPIVKIALCLPFYDGPDVHTFDEYFAHMAYYGRLQERASIREQIRSKEAWSDMDEDEGATGDWWDDFNLPKLDAGSDTGHAELHDDDPMFEFIFCKQVKNSLPGQAREACVDLALKYDANYCFFFDSDMLFAKETLLRLYRHQEPVVYALAFTGREPILPVVYRWDRKTDIKTGITNIDSDWVEDYPRNTLFRCDAHGAGVFLVHTDVFKQLKKGWFNAQGAGEDIHFCRLCYDAGIPIYCDSSIWTAHKPNFPMFWHDEAFYDESQKIRAKITQSVLTQKFMDREVPVA